MKTIKCQQTYYGDLCTAVGTAVDDVYPTTIGDGDQIVSVEDDTVAVLVGDFVYYVEGNGSERLDPTWEHCTAADYAKWILG
jgi:hypothetical protein